MDLRQQFIKEHKESIICEPSGKTLSEIEEIYEQMRTVIYRK